MAQYLDSLLTEIDDVSVEPAPQILIKEAVVSEIEVKPFTTPVIVPPIAIKSPPQPVVYSESGVQSEEEHLFEIPEWANEPFKTLLFKVGGMMVAAPLKSLNGILKWSDESHKLPGLSPSYLGVLPHRGVNINLVDSARLLLGEDKAYKGLSDEALQRHFIVMIARSRLGLVCDNVEKVVVLDKASVRWRLKRSKHPWYAGIINEHMCAMLDIDVIAEMLNT